MGIDSLWSYQLDITKLAADSTSVIGGGAMHSVEPQAIFGASTTFAAPMTSSGPGQVLMTDVNYLHLIVAMLFVSYCIAIVAYPNQTISLLKTVVNRIYSDKLLEERSRTVTSALHVFTLLGCMGFCALAVRVSDVVGLDSGTASQIKLWAAPAVALLIVAIGLYQWLVLGVAGYLMRNHAFVGSIWYLKEVVFSLSTIVMAPLCFIYFLNYDASSSVILYLIVFLAIVFVFVWLFKSYRLFVGQNFSILHWFLYLCGVELLPLSFFVLLAVR